MGLVYREASQANAYIRRSENYEQIPLYIGYIEDQYLYLL